MNNRLNPEEFSIIKNDGEGSQYFNSFKKINENVSDFFKEKLLNIEQIMMEYLVEEFYGLIKKYKIKLTDEEEDEELSLNIIGKYFDLESFEKGSIKLNTLEKIHQSSKIYMKKIEDFILRNIIMVIRDRNCRNILESFNTVIINNIQLPTEGMKKFQVDWLYSSYFNLFKDFDNNLYINYYEEEKFDIIKELFYVIEQWFGISLVNISDDNDMLSIEIKISEPNIYIEWKNSGYLTKFSFMEDKTNQKRERSYYEDDSESKKRKLEDEMEVD